MISTFRKAVKVWWVGRWYINNERDGDLVNWGYFPYSEGDITLYIKYFHLPHILSLSIKAKSNISDMFTNGIEVSRYQFYCKIGVHSTALKWWKIKKEKGLNQGDDIMTDDCI